MLGDYPPSSDTTSSLVTESCSRSSLIFFSRLEYGCSSMPSLWVGGKISEIGASRVMPGRGEGYVGG